MNTTTTSDQTAPTRPLPGDGAGADRGADRAARFAESVCAQLADLPAEDRDDLVDGLEADLVERLADGGELGDPIAYADELRLAAGLPPRGEAGSARPQRTLRELADVVEARLGVWAEATAARKGTWDFIRSLRPVWWVLRGLGVAAAVLAVIGQLTWAGNFVVPRSLFAGFVVGSVAIVLSVQWGRGVWLPKQWMVWLRRAGTVIAVPVLVFVGASTANGVNTAQTVTETTTSFEPGGGGLTGLTANGTQVSNIFAYDCSGKLLDGVRLLDQSGNPILTTDTGDDSAEARVPDTADPQTGQSVSYSQNVLGIPIRAGWAVFPLRQIQIGLDGETEAPRDGVGVAARPKLDSLGAICAASPTGGAPGPSPAPSATPTPTP